MSLENTKGEGSFSKRRGKASSSRVAEGLRACLFFLRSNQQPNHPSILHQFIIHPPFINLLSIHPSFINLLSIHPSLISHPSIHHQFIIHPAFINLSPIHHPSIPSSLHQFHPSPSPALIHQHLLSPQPVLGCRGCQLGNHGPGSQGPLHLAREEGCPARGRAEDAWDPGEP